MFGSYLALLVGICCAALFYKLGEQDYGSGLITLLASIAVSVLTIVGLKTGVFGTLAAQAGLFIGLWVYNVLKAERSTL